MSGPSNYLLNATGDYVMSNVNPFITQLTTSNSNIPGSTFTPVLGDWIYYLFWDPTAAYTVIPSSTITSVNFVVVGGGSGGNGGNEDYGIINANDEGIILAGGSSGAVCAGSVGVNTSTYSITVGAGGAGSNNGGNNPPLAGNSSSIVAADGGNITCGFGSPAQNVTGIAGTVYAVSSNDLSSITISSQNNSNNIPNFGIGGTVVNFGSNANINGGPGIQITFSDGTGSTFLLGGGGGGGNDYEDGQEGGVAAQGGNGSAGLGGQGGNSSAPPPSPPPSPSQSPLPSPPDIGAGGGGGGGGSINSINTQYIGSAQNGDNGYVNVENYYINGNVSYLGGNGGNANVGGGGGGGGTLYNGSGGQGGNGLVMLYYQIPYTTVSNGLTVKSQAGAFNVYIPPTQAPNVGSSSRSILPNTSSNVLHFEDSNHPISHRWLDGNDLCGGFHVGHDKRLQKNITPMPNALDKMMLLNPIHFKMDNDKVHAGFSSDNMSNMFPGVISKGKYMEELQDNVEGINMTGLVPMLVKSIQELKTEMDTVKQNNDKLTVEDVVDFVKNLWSKYKNKK